MVPERWVGISTRPELFLLHRHLERSGHSLKPLLLFVSFGG